MQPGPFSFHHYSPIQSWCKLFESHNFASRVTCTFVLLAFIFLHVIIVHMAYVVVETNPQFAQVIFSNKTTDRPRHFNVNNTSRTLIDLTKRSRKVFSVSVFKIVIVGYDNGEQNLLESSLERCSRWFHWNNPLQDVLDENNRNIVNKGHDATGMSPGAHEEAIHSKVNSVILDMLNCNMKSLSQSDITNNYNMSIWSHTGLKNYNKCVKEFHYNHTMAAVSKCLPLLTNACLLSNIRYVKISNLSLSLISKILSYDPEVYLINLIRDPRSLMQVRGVPMDKIQKSLSLTCETMRQDIKVFQALRRQHPLRVIQTRYEDIMSQPFHSIRRVFNFFDLPCHVNKVNLIPSLERRLMPAGRTHNVNVKPKWHRRLFMLNDVRDNLSQCDDVLTYFGYRVK